MAITGFILFGFVVVHMLGNLQIFLGPKTLNAYAAFLKSKPALLWSARLALFSVVALHIVSALQLSIENKRARPIPYGHYQIVAASYASRTMLMSGVIIFVFIVYHLLHFSVAVPAVNFLSPNPNWPSANFLDLRDPLEHHDVFRMMVLGYSNVWVSGFYILGMALLCLHLSHGLSSMVQSVGMKNERNSQWIEGFARLAAAVIFAGNCSIPIAVMLGYGR